MRSSSTLVMILGFLRLALAGSPDNHSTPTPTPTHKPTPTPTSTKHVYKATPIPSLGNHTVPNVLVVPEEWLDPLGYGVETIKSFCQAQYDMVWHNYGVKGCNAKTEVTAQCGDSLDKSLNTLGRKGSDKLCHCKSICAASLNRDVTIGVISNAEGKLNRDAIGIDGGDANGSVEHGLVTIARHSHEGYLLNRSRMPAYHEAPNFLIYQQMAGSPLNKPKGETMVQHCQNLFKQTWFKTGVPKECSSDVAYAGCKRSERPTAQVGCYCYKFCGGRSDFPEEYDSGALLLDPAPSTQVREYITARIKHDNFIDKKSKKKNALVLNSISYSALMELVPVNDTQRL